MKQKELLFYTHVHTYMHTQINFIYTFGFVEWQLLLVSPNEKQINVSYQTSKNFPVTAQ